MDEFPLAVLLNEDGGIHRGFIAMCKSESLVAAETQRGRTIRNGPGESAGQQDEREDDNATANKGTMGLASAMNL
jgi:hypothetical protein